MKPRPISDPLYSRDGASQADRRPAALNPAHFQLDERSIEDLLAFAQEFSRRLTYYNAENEAQGDWSAFLEGDPAEMAAFLEDPTAFDHFPEKKERYSRPHLVLFLTFLKLLQGVKTEINQLTRRQMDFYYQDALGFVKKTAVPDRVHVLAQLRRGQEELLIPKGTLLDAGKDRQGNPLRYCTEEDLIANRTQVARLMSLHVDKEVIDIPMLRFLGKKEHLSDRGFMSILRLVYRKPGSTDSLREFPIDLLSQLPFDEESIISDLDYFRHVITEGLKVPMGIFQRIIMEYHKWHEESHWKATTGTEKGINDYLFQFYEKRKRKEGEPVVPEPFKDDIRDFDENFKTALNFTIKGDKNDGTNVFEGLAAVDDLYDLYDRYFHKEEQPDEDVLQFITDHFDGESAFGIFMKLRTDGLAALRRIHHLLWEVAVRNPDISDPNYLVYLDYEKGKTLANAFKAILKLDRDRNDQNLLWAEPWFQAIESYFGMHVEDYYFIRDLYNYPRNPKDVPEWKWRRADQLLEQAYASYYNSLSGSEKKAMPPKPRLERWCNLYQAPDATQLMATSPERNDSHPRWKTFGARPDGNTDPKILHPSEIGWAIYSPALILTEGKRTITLKLTFTMESFEAQRPVFQKYLKTWPDELDPRGPYPFRLDISTKKNWITISDWDAFFIPEDSPEFHLTITVSEDFDPLAPVEDDAYQSNWPGLRLVLPKRDLTFMDSRGKKHLKSVYDLFKGQQLTKAKLDIKVIGLKNLKIQTKDGIVKPQKAFPPFGIFPEIGDRLYLTHPEIARQKLDTVDFELEWKKLPAGGFATHYAAYQSLIDAKTEIKNPYSIDPKTITSDTRLLGNDIPGITINSQSFKASLSLVQVNTQLTTRRPLPLFKDDSTTINIMEWGGFDTHPTYKAPYLALPNAVLGREVTDSDRYLVWELGTHDFLHSLNNLLLNRQRQELSRQARATSSAALAGNKEAEIEAASKNIENLSISLPEPFTPVIKRISVNYSTAVEIDWRKRHVEQEHQAAHIEPFGEVPLPASGRPIRFLPEFEAEGSLYIGLEGLQAPQEISFLFQMAAGSANPELLPAPVRWAYLSQDQWIAFQPGQILQDSSQGLLTSGLIRLFIPETASTNNLRMPGHLHWIRLQVDNDSGSLSDCIQIHTQGLSAIWQDTGRPSDHLNQPLPPDNIKKPVEPLRGLAGLVQPYTSFQGEAAESETEWYPRVSEQLRHRTRALTLWDYEHLALEHFPDIYKAKALSADLFEQEDPPGTVRVVVLPDIQQRPAFDPFEPRVPVVRLQQIQAFLQQQAPPFARVRVQNARFLHLKMRLAVRFIDMQNFWYYAKQLDHALQKYLTPWASDHSVDIVFGGKIYPSVIVDFIENRPYVDFIEQPEFRLLAKDANGVFRVLEEQPLDAEGLLTITAPDTIIVSAYNHFIEYLPTLDELPGRIRRGIGFNRIEYDFQLKLITQGIGCMVIENDFQIAPAGPEKGIGFGRIGYDFQLAPAGSGKGVGFSRIGFDFRIKLN